MNATVMFYKQATRSEKVTICVREWDWMWVPTISKQLKDGEVHLSLPDGFFLDGDAVACGRKHFPRADGDQLTALVSSGHVIQHCSVIDEGIQLSVIQNETHLSLNESSQQTFNPLRERGSFSWARTPISPHQEHHVQCEGVCSVWPKLNKCIMNATVSINITAHIFFVLLKH